MPGDAPRVSVITPVFNGERFLAEAVESILAQTFTDFEYLLVDDAATDASPAILARYAQQDQRAMVLHNAVNVNHSNAVNTALRVARGEFIAILDADDLAHPERLACQVRFLDAHPTVGVVGAQVQQIDGAGRIRHAMTFPVTCELARWSILFATPVLHSAAMIRRDLLQQIGGYSVQWRYANDFSLWAELIGRTGIANLPETLASYRRHDQQTSSVFATPQQGEVWLLIYRMLVELDDIGVLYHGVRGELLPDAAALDRAANLLAAIRTRYLAVEQPDAATTAQIDADCAKRLLTLAWVHRHSQRATSRVLLQQALAFDPRLLHRPQTGASLRRLRQRQRP
jgi:hypothetical protein